MIGRLFAASVANDTQTASKTLMSIDSGALAINFIERIYITNTSFDTSENTGTTVQRFTADGTGDANAPEPMMVGDTWGGIVLTNHTIEPTYTATEEILQLGWNVLSGLLWTPANDDEVIVIPPAVGVGVGFNLDVAISSMDLSYGATIREIA